MCVLAQTKPDQRNKKEQCFQSPERARISWGRATRVGGPGEGPYRARGVLYKWALPKFNSGNVPSPAMLDAENDDDCARVPVSRPVPRVAPKREEPPATVPVVAPHPSSPAAKFDGIWVGPFNCGVVRFRHSTIRRRGARRPQPREDPA